MCRIKIANDFVFGQTLGLIICVHGQSMNTWIFSKQIEEL